MDLFTTIIIYSYAFLIASYAIGFVIVLIMKTRKEKINKRIFFSTLDRCIEKNIPISTKSLIQLYNGIYRKGIDSIDSKIVRILSEYKVRIVDSYEGTNIKEIEVNISKLICDFEKKLPFSSLPAIEKGVFRKQ